MRIVKFYLVSIYEQKDTNPHDISILLLRGRDCQGTMFFSLKNFHVIPQTPVKNKQIPMDRLIRLYVFLTVSNAIFVVLYGKMRFFKQAIDIAPGRCYNTDNHSNALTGKPESTTHQRAAVIGWKPRRRRLLRIPPPSSRRTCFAPKASRQRRYR